MKTLRSKAILILVGLSSVYQVNATENQNNNDQKFNFSGAFYGGVRYDSNVNVSELDNNTDISDNAVKLSGDIKGKYKFSDAFAATATASHSATRYQEQSGFDLGLTTLGAAVSYKTAIATFGLHHYNASASLDSKEFLDYKRSGISAGNLALTKGYWRLSIDKINTAFETQPRRDSKGHSTRGDFFWFVTAEQFFKLGIQYQTQDAVTDEFDYNEYTADMGMTYTTEYFSNPMSFKVSYEYLNRQYGFSETLENTRDDDRHVIKADINYTVMDNVEVILKTQYGGFNSNLITADYDEAIAEMGVRFQF